MFPKHNEINNEYEIRATKRYLVEKHEISIDRYTCVSCGICSSVCPKQAITIDNPDVVLKTKPKKLGGAAIHNIDATKCVYCGACQVFCPFDAIHLTKNEIRVPTDELTLVKEKALPQLQKRKQKCFRLKHDATIYWKGEIKFLQQPPQADADFLTYYHTNCPANCSRCEEICPTDAIKIRSEKDAVKSKTIIDLDEELCVKCGACANACYLNLWQVKWQQIDKDGSYNAIFWDPIESKLLKRELVYHSEPNSKIH